MNKPDFDKEVDRKGTDTYKWDNLQFIWPSISRDDFVPLWVADMDFPVAPVIQDALERRVGHAVYGYSYPGEDYFRAVVKWFSDYHDYHFAATDIVPTTGVVPAISAIIRAFTKPGDGVLIQPPVYNCFFSTVENNSCRKVESPLLRVDYGDGTFSYKMDFEDMERKCKDGNVKLFLLCNPHNPAGRAWTHEELAKVAEICGRNGVRVISDEIHNELTQPGTEYTPYAPVAASVNNNNEPRPIVCCSPSKSFNTAGLHIANVICPDKATLEMVASGLHANEATGLSPFGIESVKAAYSVQGKEWLNNLRDYIWSNYEFMLDFMRRNLPEFPVTRLEATYLPWVDVRALGMPSKEIEKSLLENEGVWINGGEMYGGEGFVRFNIACPRHQLEEGLQRFLKGVKRILKH